LTFSWSLGIVQNSLVPVFGDWFVEGRITDPIITEPFGLGRIKTIDTNTSLGIWMT
jgi:hypothetical protein